ncbi:conserved hypothetical protein [Histoplasma capsulatum var. duboisii H88]|uniref:Uncharacterized protein n=1 Tax=Ajellomyces capsulatus (strain H88) TaxID=544711 RepID=F0UM43_AJEC8|nr:conserved hypothetical protein [Histoplasma capsulatum var. duboisii H88]
MSHLFNQNPKYYLLSASRQEAGDDQSEFQCQSPSFLETINEDFANSDSDNDIPGEEALLFPAEPFNKDAADNVDHIEWLLKATAEENISENILKNDDQEDSDEIDTSLISLLSEGLSTLKKQCRSQFPILSVKKTSIPIVSSMQMSTLSSAQKHLTESSLRSLYFQNPIPLISALLKSPNFQQQMYIGMAEIINNPTELWQSHSWGSSVKYCSGKFA